MRLLRAGEVKGKRRAKERWRTEDVGGEEVVLWVERDWRRGHCWFEN